MDAKDISKLFAALSLGESSKFPKSWTLDMQYAYKNE